MDNYANYDWGIVTLAKMGIIGRCTNVEME